MGRPRQTIKKKRKKKKKRWEWVEPMFVSSICDVAEEVMISRS
jgi:hypothetical protein